MGNVILMAVRHRDLDAVEKLDFNDIEHAYTHRADSLPKPFDGSELWISQEDCNFNEAIPNVIMSQYYHYNSSALIYIDDTQMYTSANLSHSHFSKNPNFDFNEHVPGLKKIFRREKTSVLDRKGKLSQSVFSGDKVSLFKIWTDCIDRVEDNEHVMTDIVHYCHTNEIRSRTFGSLNMGIGVVGTLDADKAAFVRVFDATVTLHQLDRFKIKPDEDAIKAIREFYAQGNFSKAYDLQDFTFCREIAAASGYLIKKTIAKKSE